MTQQPVEQCDFQEKGVRLGVGVNVSQGAEQGLLGRFPCPWGEAGRLWLWGSWFDLSLPVGNSVWDSHPGPVQ